LLIRGGSCEHVEDKVSEEEVEESESSERIEERDEGREMDMSIVERIIRDVRG
jgi:hypothetical protein